MVSGEGTEIDPKDFEAVLQLKKKAPKTVGEVRTLLGFLSYYRSFIQDFSRLAKPLYELLQNPKEETALKVAKTSQGKQKVRKGTKAQMPSRTPIQWTSEHRAIVSKFIEMLTNPLILVYPDFDLPFRMSECS